MEVKVKVLNPEAHMPTRGSDYAAGWDLYAITPDKDVVTIPPHATVKIGTGLSFELPENTFGAIFPRSGLATKNGLRPANCVGVCDEDYRGEVCVGLVNVSNEPYTIQPDERIAQMVIAKYEQAKIEVVTELSDTVRGEGGFGSTGK